MFDLKGKIRVKISEQTICQRYISKYYPNGIVVPNLKIIPPYDKGLDGSFYIYERNNQVWWNNEDTKQKGMGWVATLSAVFFARRVIVVSFDMVSSGDPKRRTSNC